MAAAGALWAVVPVKTLAEAKRRLAGRLSEAMRRRLAEAMLEDVLAALAPVPGLAGILVVTCDPAAAALARRCGAATLAAPADDGLSAAAALAARHLRAAGAGGMLVVPADVPLATPAELARLVAAHRPAPSVSLVPAEADGGSNALLCSPPDILPFCFGTGSFAAHLAAARARGIEPTVLPLAGLGLDIDRPADLAALAALPGRTRSHAVLAAEPRRRAVGSD